MLLLRRLEGLRERVRRMPLRSLGEAEREVPFVAPGGVLAGVGERPRETLRAAAGEDMAEV